VNEDAWARDRLASGEVLLVADGMGGHRAGEVASALAVDTLLEGLRQLSVSPPDRLARAFQRANLAVYQQATRRSESRGMGTTLTAVLLDDQYAIVGHVGDSRAYLVRDGALLQLTRDHSWVAERVRQGLLTEAEAREHRWRNIITNALGSQPQLRLDLSGEELREGDALLVCSDGLTGVLTDEVILEVLRAHAFDPAQRAVEALVEAANAAGGPDNVTAVLARVRGLRPRPKAYSLPRLGDDPAPEVRDPHPDATDTMVIEPARRPRLEWLGLGLLALCLAAVTLALWLR
jgi:protein phosphatase